MVGVPGGGVAVLDSCGESCCDEGLLVDGGGADVVMGDNPLSLFRAR